jgi:rubredoxin
MRRNFMNASGSTGPYWVAAIEYRTSARSGAQHVVRLHAISVSGLDPHRASACGYVPASGEVRPNRSWETVTKDIRCPSCSARISHPDPTGVIDLDGAGRQRQALPDPDNVSAMSPPA